jgi:thioredoxin-like negative regulator of GroEL
MIEEHIRKNSDSYRKIAPKLRTSIVATMTTMTTMTTTEQAEIQKEYKSPYLRELIGANVKDVTRNITQNVLVMFYANWCAVCTEFLPE